MFAWWANYKNCIFQCRITDSIKEYLECIRIDWILPSRMVIIVPFSFTNFNPISLVIYPAKVINSLRKNTIIKFEANALAYWYEKDCISILT